MCFKRIFCFFIVVQPPIESNNSQQPKPEASQSIRAPDPDVPVSQVPKLVEVPEAKPEPKQVPMLQWPSQAVLEIKV